MSSFNFEVSHAERGARLALAAASSVLDSHRLSLVAGGGELTPEQFRLWCSIQIAVVDELLDCMALHDALRPEAGRG